MESRTMRSSGSSKELEMSHAWHYQIGNPQTSILQRLWLFDIVIQVMKKP
jgi:hypothetical protein